MKQDLQNLRKSAAEKKAQNLLTVAVVERGNGKLYARDVRLKVKKKIVMMIMIMKVIRTGISM
jgi:hypothetical protein